MSNINDDIITEIANLNKVIGVAIKDIQKELVRRIKTRIRSGKGVADDSQTVSQEVNLAPLSKNYIEQRSKMKLSPFGKPTKSNLTRSGEMVASIKGEVLKDTIVIFLGSPEANKKAEWVSEARPFFALTEEENTYLDTAISEAVDKYLNS